MLKREAHERPQISLLREHDQTLLHSLQQCNSPCTDGPIQLRMPRRYALDCSRMRQQLSFVLTIEVVTTIPVPQALFAHHITVFVADIAVTIQCQCT